MKRRFQDITEQCRVSVLQFEPFAVDVHGGGVGPDALWVYRPRGTGRRSTSKRRSCIGVAAFLASEAIFWRFCAVCGRRRRPHSASPSAWFEDLAVVSCRRAPCPSFGRSPLRFGACLCVSMTRVRLRLRFRVRACWGFAACALVHAGTPHAGQERNARHPGVAALAPPRRSRSARAASPHGFEALQTMGGTLGESASPAGQPAEARRPALETKSTGRSRSRTCVGSCRRRQRP